MTAECRCDGGGWLPEMCLGRWRCPCADNYTPNEKNRAALSHVEEMCADCIGRGLRSNA